MRCRWCRLVLVGAMCVTAVARAQQSANIPIRELSPVVLAGGALRSISGIKQLADGRVLVNDVLGKKILMFDSTLQSSTIVADSSGKPALYPNSGSVTNLFHYLGDSTLFPDHTAQAFLVIEPSGKVGRALALPKPGDMRLLSQPSVGNPAFDQKGRFVYRAGQPVLTGPNAQQGRARDTIPIVRADFDSRMVDTITSVTLPVLAFNPVVYDSKGVPSIKRVINPMPLPPDEWAVTTDGSIAVLRSNDYHVDWVYPSGEKISTPKMPFDWRRLTDADKQARIDSAKHVIDSLAKTPRPYGMSISYRSGQAKPDTVYPTIEFVPIDSMPDYVPPFRAASLRADRDNHLWIPPTTSAVAAGPNNILYDVINTKGEIVERVRVPADRVIVGFGPGGVVYLMKGDREKGYTLERHHVIR